MIVKLAELAGPAGAWSAAVAVGLYLVVILARTVARMLRERSRRRTITETVASVATGGVVLRREGPETLLVIRPDRTRATWDPSLVTSSPEVRLLLDGVVPARPEVHP
jgi:hypothetical protein